MPRATPSVLFNNIVITEVISALKTEFISRHSNVFCILISSNGYSHILQCREFERQNYQTVTFFVTQFLRRKTDGQKAKTKQKTKTYEGRVARFCNSTLGIYLEDRVE